MAVAHIAVLAQDAYNATRPAYFDDVRSFPPAHALAAHRRLGSVMRARLHAYQALSAYRHAQNRSRQVDPSDSGPVSD